MIIDVWELWHKAPEIPEAYGDVCLLVVHVLALAGAVE